MLLTRLFVETLQAAEKVDQIYPPGTPRALPSSLQCASYQTKSNEGRLTNLILGGEKVELEKGRNLTASIIRLVFPVKVTSALVSDAFSM